MGSRSHSAPASAAGYLFQPERALYWLAKKTEPTSVIGIETTDDVCVKDGPDGPLVLVEQDKYSESHIPFGNTSKDLWNTLMIWLKAIDSGVVDVQRAEFLLVTNRVVPEYRLVKMIDKAEKSDQISECVAKLRKTGQDAPKGIAKQVAFVLSRSDEELATLISRIRLQDGSKNASGPTLRLEIAKLLPISDDLQAKEIIQSLLAACVTNPTS